MEAGLNLFSIRNLITTPEDYLDTAFKLKDMGYSYLQHSGAAFDPPLLKKVTEETGLPVVLTHVPMDRIINDTDLLMKEHESFGCRYIGLGCMNVEDLCVEEKMKKSVASLEAAAERMEKEGFRFFYHHHHFEFFRISEGITILEYMIKNAPHISFTLDTYWAQFGGADIKRTAEKLKGRISCVHLKDYKVERNRENTGFYPTFAPVGDGNIDFSDILPVLKSCGVEYYLVEQDNAADLPDTLGEVERSIRYIKSSL